MRMTARFAAAGLLTAVLSASSAHAGDMMGKLRQTLKPGADEDTAITWYLRGDISRSYYNEPTSEYIIVFTNPRIGPVDFRNESIKPNMGASIGVGLRWRFARLDVSFETRDATRYQGYNPPFNDWNHAGPFPVPSRLDHYTINSRTIMANGYIDLGTWLGVTPYVGAGAGVTMFKTGGTYVSDPVPLAAQLGAVTEIFSNGNNKTWSPSWALMAGFSVKFTDNIILDAGYRYANLGKLKFDHIEAATGKIYTNNQTGNIVSHDVRLGIRYEFGSTTKILPKNTFALRSYSAPGMPL